MALIEKKYAESQNVATQQQKKQLEHEKLIQNWSEKYNKAINHLRSQLEASLQEEAVLTEKWKGKSQLMTDIRSTLASAKVLQNWLIVSRNIDVCMQEATEHKLDTLQVNFFSMNYSLSFIVALQKDLAAAREVLKRDEELYKAENETNATLNKNLLTLKTTSKVCIYYFLELCH